MGEVEPSLLEPSVYMFDWQRSKAMELELYTGISSVGNVTLAASAVRCLTCHSLNINAERVLCVSSEKG